MHRHRADTTRDDHDAAGTVGSGGHVGSPFLPGAERARRRRTFDPVVFEELAALVSDAATTDVLVVGGQGTWVDRGRGLERARPELPERRARALAAELVALGGRHVDESKPTF
ncbi:hypothetical protein QUG98_09735 [Curtobacterium sp. RHCJP20]|uniref:Uncharacterized protein n=1 Tax=Curtobacterium subtropicum TaxID=3055138 RepID=A0ABT7TIP1_9MICO|nr:hypothetical protein [Curtobacterium subtropicum]MDM7888734.1 hypothetical protein [Curtobacterium subtropicum]